MNSIRSRAGENTRKMPLLRNRGAERSLHENRAYQAGKTTDIWFDEKEPLIHIRTHNTDLKNRLTAYAAAYPASAVRPTQTRTRAAWSL